MATKVTKTTATSKQKKTAKAKKTVVRAKKPRTVKIAVIGLGARAETLLASIFKLEGCEVVAVCDFRDEAIDKILGIFKKHGAKLPDTYHDYREILKRPDVEGVLAPTSWNSHLQIAVEAMNAGKYVGIEVGGASSIDECWQLVHAAEKTGVSCMMLENCCYGRNELMVMNMVRQGLFGELIHCEGGYEHALGYMGHQVETGFERSLHNRARCGDVYPTHELGPIAKILDINRGNRFLSLTSTASKARGFALDAQRHYGRGTKWGDVHFNMGDIVVTVIKCANGETITMTHGVSLPRPYSRNGRVQGTKGIWLENANGMWIEGISKIRTEIDVAGNPYEEHEWDKVEDFYEKYDHPIWKEYTKRGVIGGHNGIDGLTLMAFFDAIREHRPTPIDVYDCASWMSMTCLSEQSIAMGSAPVAFPDFTNGKWIERGRDTESGIFAL